MKAKKSKDKKTRKGKRLQKEAKQKGDRKTMKRKRWQQANRKTDNKLNCPELPDHSRQAAEVLQKDNVANFLIRHARQQKQKCPQPRKSGKKGIVCRTISASGPGRRWRPEDPLLQWVNW